MYEKFFVYLDDGKDVYKIAIAAVSEEAARAWCAGNGEVIAVKNVTEEYHIDAGRVRKALEAAEFQSPEIDWMCRALQGFEIIE